MSTSGSAVAKFNYIYKIGGGCNKYNNSNSTTVNASPKITSLSSYYSLIGSNTLLTIFGSGFNRFATVVFGTVKITEIFYTNSGQIAFYIPMNTPFGTYPIQVFYQTYYSNVVNFTVENNNSYWNIDPASNVITNNNTNGMQFNGLVNFKNQCTLQAQLTYKSNVINITFDASYTVAPSNGNMIFINGTATGAQIYIDSSTAFDGDFLEFRKTGTPAPDILIISSTANIIDFANIQYTSFLFPSSNTYMRIIYNGSDWYLTNLN